MKGHCVAMGREAFLKESAKHKSKNDFGRTSFAQSDSIKKAVL